MRLMRTAECAIAMIAFVVGLTGCGGDSTAPALQDNEEPVRFPVTGMPVPGMASVDGLVAGVMKNWNVPGAAVGITKDGRLVFAHGYGYADVDAKELVQPDSRFRIGSLSKPITAVTILKLVEDGVLDLSDRAFQLLDHLEPPPGASADPRLDDITVRHLLYHSGGWDRTKTFDPFERSGIAAAAVGVAPPASAETFVRYMLGQPLDFDPGTRYAYSSFGYGVLGRVIERVTGQSYEAFVQDAVLAPMAIQRMQIGGTRLSERADGEVRYYKPDLIVESVFPDEGQVPWPYGGQYLEAADAAGGWIGSTVDLLRFLTAVDGFPERPDVLTEASVDLMLARPVPELHAGSGSWYGMGWRVVGSGDGANWWHFGYMPGTQAYMGRLNNDWWEEEEINMGFVMLLNTSKPGLGGVFGAMDDLLWEIVESVTSWPTHDLFDEFP